MIIIKDIDIYYSLEIKKLAHNNLYICIKHLNNNYITDNILFL